MNNSDVYKRRTIRLSGFDYKSENAYFITICTQNRDCILGYIENAYFKANEAGKMVEKYWVKLENKFQNIRLDEYILMPNHLHGIITIVGADPCVCPAIGAIIQWYKTMTTNEYIKNVKQNSWAPFNKRIWQRNFYEHIIRNNEEMHTIRNYIKNNPMKWDYDKDNPQRIINNL